MCVDCVNVTQYFRIWLSLKVSQNVTYIHDSTLNYTFFYKSTCSTKHLRQRYNDCKLRRNKIKFNFKNVSSTRCLHDIVGLAEFVFVRYCHVRHCILSLSVTEMIRPNQRVHGKQYNFPGRLHTTVQSNDRDRSD